MAESAELTREIPAEAEGMLAPEALAFVADLHRTFNPRRKELLERRHLRHQSIRDGQDGERPTATLVIVTHEASELSLAGTVSSLSASPVVSNVVSVLRVEGL